MKLTKKRLQKHNEWFIRCKNKETEYSNTIDTFKDFYPDNSADLIEAFKYHLDTIAQISHKLRWEKGRKINKITVISFINNYIAENMDSFNNFTEQEQAELFEAFRNNKLYIEDGSWV